MDGRIEDGVKSRVGWGWEVPSETGILRGGILATGGVYWKAREFGVLADGAVEPDGGPGNFLMFIGEDMMEWSKEEQVYLVVKLRGSESVQARDPESVLFLDTANNCQTVVLAYKHNRVKMESKKIAKRATSLECLYLSSCQDKKVKHLITRR